MNELQQKWREKFRYAGNMLELIVARICDKQDGLGDYPLMKKHGESKQ